MTKRNQLIIYLILAALILLPATAPIAKSSKWELITKEEGIIVDRREKEGSGILEFRGRGMVNAQIVEIMSAIADPPSRKKWIEGCLEVKVLKQLSETENVFYYAQEAPWPLNDRDYVARSRFIVDEKKRWVHIKVKSIKNYKGGPKRDRVRMPFLYAKWSLKPLKKGKATWVEFWVQADPGGVVPNWAANLVSKKIPLKTIKKLRKFLKKNKADNAFVEKYKKYKNWY